METTREQLVADAIGFMQSIVGHYGEQKGLEMWETIADACDPALKGDVFIKMLTGDFGGRITVKGVRPDANAVSCIKAIRSIDKRAPGLKEAKDMYDRVARQRALGERSNEYLQVMHEKYHHAVLALRNVGFNI